jgi:anti-sigma factor RsiW
MHYDQTVSTTRCWHVLTAALYARSRLERRERRRVERAMQQCEELAHNYEHVLTKRRQRATTAQGVRRLPPPVAIPYAYQVR